MLLTKISNFSIQVLEPALNNTWPPALNLAQPADNSVQLVQGDSRLPQGVQVEFTINDRPVIWRFSLVKKLPEQLTEQTSANGSNNSNSNNNQNTGVSP